MSKDTSYESEQERERPTVIWNDYGKFNGLDSRLRALFSFLAVQEQSRVTLTQIKVEVFMTRGGKRELAANIITVPCPSIAADDRQFKETCRRVIEREASKDFEMAEITISVTQANATNPYATFTLGLNEAKVLHAVMRDHVYGESFLAKGIGYVKTTSNLDTLTFMLSDVIGGVILGAKLACIAATKKAFAEVTL